MPVDVTSFEASSLDPQQQENTFVHDVYDRIASHFSQTRYKPWPIISQFLASLTPGSIGLDSGCGNGKYLPLDQGGKVVTIGFDRSLKLLEIAQRAGGVSHDREVVLGDVLDNCWRVGVFDYAISIATIHHLSTSQRRRQSVETLLKCLHPAHGRLMIYVWAVEQDALSKRVIPGTDNSDALSGRDTLVPWVRSSEPKGKPGSGDPSITQPKVFRRYYHFFAKGELRGVAQAAAVQLGLVFGPQDLTTHLGVSGTVRGVEVINEGWERSNLYIELKLWEVRI